MSAPAVSVVIPVFNRAHLVSRAIGSVLAQSFRDFEILVVDDGSTDDLAGALAAIAAPQLRLIHHERNRGAGAARNTGIAASRGAFLAFLDSDDAWHPEKLAFQVAAMRDQPPEIAGHVCGYEVHRDGYPVRRFLPDWSPAGFARSVLHGCTCGPGTTLLCRREAWAAVGPLSEELRRLEDWEWLLRLAEAGYALAASPVVLAQVFATDSPSPQAVRAALREIERRHGAGQGWRADRMLRSSLHLERAAIEFRDGRRLEAAWHLARSLACHPFRNLAFYRRMAGHLLHIGAPRRRLPGRRPDSGEAGTALPERSGPATRI